MADTFHFDANRLFNTKGLVCVITGGGTGIGLMASQALAANGAKVYITGRRMEVLENAARTHHPNEYGGSIIPIGPTDVRSKNELQALVKDLQKKEKHINLLMVNAGFTGPRGKPDEEDADAMKEKLWENETVDEWQETFQTLVTSVYFTTVAFLPLLQAGIDPHGPLEQFQPSVITTSSISGMMRHSQGHFAYNAAKGATVHLTKMMSAEFGKAYIRVNSIAPGYFPSEMTDRNKTSDEKHKSEFPQEKIENYGHVPLMRPGREEEMGMAVLFLAKNPYINGQILAVDGGVMNVVGS